MPENFTYSLVSTRGDSAAKGSLACLRLMKLTDPHDA